MEWLPDHGFSPPLFGIVVRVCSISASSTHCLRYWPPGCSLGCGAPVGVEGDSSRPLWRPVLSLPLHWPPLTAPYRGDSVEQVPPGPSQRKHQKRVDILTQTGTNGTDQRVGTVPEQSVSISHQLGFLASPS
ncbi:hypothetical protein E2C01_017844 [Portunus trituberculatus]|uniref:Uncharacterized protein n=1 Tax=Portunus trituberculatus TaxID=210409 RepID=A0A5B7DTI7_PORTR|nr:hypothetical protein [Portunus trituberculatus]